MRTDRSSGLHSGLYTYPSLPDTLPPDTLPPTLDTLSPGYPTPRKDMGPEIPSEQITLVKTLPSPCGR